ncbi:hypothetical protein VNO78_16987 [Psophocarpus tetragonolobus]|uniref:VQ domain-containing protein n=1 Tax=Psophocarpus tetragonolobus TaxID=3891 RepID=A0AAN9SM99_PSOTE
MDTMRVHQTTPTKKSKPKKKTTPHPVKVVYISNPMKIKTSASEFRALVQELTGQDAESPPDPTRFHAHHSSDQTTTSDNVLHDTCLLPPASDPSHQPPSIFDDDVFSPQMLDNISSLLPSTLFYETPHFTHW